MRFYQTAQATDFRHFDTDALFDLLAQMKKIADKKAWLSLCKTIIV